MPEALRSLVAVQAQDWAGAKWGLGQRVAGATDAVLDELLDSGTLIRTHVLRPTWHLVAPEDLRWLHALTAPGVHRASAFRYRQLEIDDPLANRASDVFRAALAGGRAATRQELAAELRRAGIDPPGQRLAYLVMRAELDAVICSGPRRGRQHTYALVDERVPPAARPSRDEALAALARRYVEGHGPAQARDLAWWSGLSVRDAQRGLEAARPAILPSRVGERTFWATPAGRPFPTGAPPERGSPIVRLLPNFDELLVAFRDRSDAMDPRLPEPVRAAEAILGHVVVRDGLVVGAWRRSDSARAGARIQVDARIGLDAPERQALRGAVEAFRTFLGRPLEVAGVD